MYLDRFRCVYFAVVTGCFRGLLRRQYDGEMQIRRHPGEGGGKGSLIYPAHGKFCSHDGGPAVSVLYDAYIFPLGYRGCSSFYVNG